MQLPEKPRPASRTRTAWPPSAPANAPITTALSGPINFDSNGDVTAAAYMVYSYGADNTAKMTGSETARSAGS